jgi:hypothetical protein
MQMRDNNQYDQDEELEAPPQLVSALKRLPQEPVFIPPTADEAILRAARRHLNPPQQPRFGWFRFLPWVAAAAAILLLVTMSACGGLASPSDNVTQYFNAEGDWHDNTTAGLSALGQEEALKARLVQQLVSDFREGQRLYDQADAARDELEEALRNAPIEIRQAFDAFMRTGTELQAQRVTAAVTLNVMLLPIRLLWLTGWRLMPGSSNVNNATALVTLP